MAYSVGDRMTKADLKRIELRWRDKRQISGRDVEWLLAEVRGAKTLPWDGVEPPQVLVDALESARRGDGA